MKKNKMMRIASALLVAVLLTTCAISGTFAKYVTSGETEDSARVAKFGVVVKGSGSLFAENYYWASSDNKPSTTGNDGPDNMFLTVESSNGDTVVAPGTKNDDVLKLSITGAPEVDVKITLAVEAFTDIFLKADAKYPDMTTSTIGDEFSFYSEDEQTDYHPVLFTLKTGDGAVVVENKTLADLKTFLETYSVYVDANTDLSASKYSYTLSWEWAFEGPYEYNYTVDTDGILMNKKKVDQADTLLGDIAAAKLGQTNVGYYDAANGVSLVGANRIVSNNEYSTDISAKLSLTVTQVD